jgi:two-component system KDP operon response regulator KdpE
LADYSVLVVEDDPAVAEVLSTALAARGYRVRTATSGREALAVAADDPADLVILDLGLPDVDGVEVCRRLRHWSRNPIIVVSADGLEDRKIAALDSGADDYLTKPFSMPELLARLRVAERHRRVAAMLIDDSFMRVGDLLIDTAARLVSIGGITTAVPRNQFAILTFLARNAGKVLTHGALMDELSKRGQPSPQALRVQINQLRRTLGTGPARPRIVSSYGTGYRLELAETAGDDERDVE